MADRRNEKLGVSFQIPDRVTVRQQLAYVSHAGIGTGADLFEKLWQGAKMVVINWQCEALPDMDVDLDTIADPRATEVILWAAMEVKQHMDRLETVPKNS